MTPCVTADLVYNSDLGAVNNFTFDHKRRLHPSEMRGFLFVHSKRECWATQQIRNGPEMLDSEITRIFRQKRVLYRRYVP